MKLSTHCLWCGDTLSDIRRKSYATCGTRCSVEYHTDRDKRNREFHAPIPYIHRRLRELRGMGSRQRLADRNVWQEGLAYG